MIAVKVVLRSDVSGVGTRGDIVEVAPGYARNFLIPRGLGFVATQGSEAQASVMRKNRALKDAKDRESAQEIAQRLVPLQIGVSARAGEGGKLFGSVTAADVAAAVAAQAHVTLDRKSIRMDDAIKTIGEHQVQVHLHAEVQFPLTVVVSGS